MESGVCSEPKDWAIGRLVDWAIGRLVDWAIGRLGDWTMWILDFGFGLKIFKNKSILTGYIFEKSGLINKKAMRKIIEDRLVNFASLVISMRENRERSDISDHLFGQVMRSATSAALNYGEAQGAETKKDFTHKVGIVLKELRESHNNLKIISNSGIYLGEVTVMNDALDECNQLIAIFHKTALTLKKKE